MTQIHLFTILLIAVLHHEVVVRLVASRRLARIIYVEEALAVWHNLTRVVGRVDQALLPELHILGFVIASKSYIIGSYVQWHAVTNVPLDSWTVTDASLDVSWQARHSRMITSVSHAHRVILAVGHADRHRSLRLVLITHLILQVKVILKRLTIFYRNGCKSFDAIICDRLLGLILVAKRCLPYGVGDHVDVSREIYLVFGVL